MPSIRYSHLSLGHLPLNRRGLDGPSEGSSRFQKKSLIPNPSVACCPSLLLHGLPIKTAVRCNKGGKNLVLTAVIPNIFGKSIDGLNTEVLAESLSLFGKLFEIYFVRLIGTPNQNSKNGSGYGRNRV